VPEFKYAKGRIAESIKFLTEEMREFEEEYAHKSWKDYQNDKKIQKLMDRTVENALTALIEICGTVLAEKGIATCVLERSGREKRISLTEPTEPTES